MPTSALPLMLSIGYIYKAGAGAHLMNQELAQAAADILKRIESYEGHREDSPVSVAINYLQTEYHAK